MATAAITLPKPRRRPRNQPVSGRASLPAFYTVKRIDNSRLRRDVNLEQRRECFALLGLSFVAFVFVFLFAWQHFQCVRFGYQIEQLKSKRADLQEQNRQLRLVQASLTDPQRIDILARHSGLAPINPQQVVRVGSGGEAPVGSEELARSFPNLGPATNAIPSGH